MPSPVLMMSLWLLWLIAIAVMDLRSRKVRNWMVLLGLGTGLVALAGGVQPFQVTAWKALLGMLAAFAALLPFYALRWMGAGDVKFAAVVGLWLGFSPQLLAIWIGGSLLAGLHGLCVLTWRRLRATPTASWLQARLPLRAATALFAADDCAARGNAPRVIERSIPYAGYMALTAIWLVLAGDPARTT
ncbi:prepilin peptidase [Pantoea sp. 18069]|uniref:A24 family peptidase n=1 Tax=Pantoea sp. 18069 TaxID=2681415 RepID=UPI001F2FD45D|nr:A24 family peptidase [Pantoea sp. 18069]